MIDEGYTKFNLDWLQAPPLASPDIDELIKWRRPLWLAGLIGVLKPEQIGYGNMSVRAGTKFIITGTQTGGLRKVTNEHFALVTDYSLKDNRLQCVGPIAASSESLTHASLYELDWSVRAVIHFHNEKLWNEHQDKLPTTSAFVPYGTPEMAQEFRRLYSEPAFIESGVAVMAGHKDGLVSFGTSVKAAAEKVIALLT